MSQGTISRRLLCVVLLAGLTLFVAGCGGGGGSGGGEKDEVLFVKKFLIVDKNYKSLGATGSTDVYRDARLLFEFSAPVDPASVSERSIRIGTPSNTPGLFEAAVGRFEGVPDRPNWVVFNPTYSRENQGTTADNPLGFEGESDYVVELQTFPDTEVYVRNLAGDALAQPFYGTFHTTEDYLPSSEQPEVTNFEPPDGATGVNSRADIRIFFTEPMKPDSFVLGSTLLIVDTDSGLIPLGDLRYSPDYRIVTFRPLFGYGKGVDSTQGGTLPLDPDNDGVPISVVVSRNVTNLAGRKLPADLRFSFRTHYDPNQPSFFDLTEEFSDNLLEDRSYGQGNVGGVTYGDNFPLADWNVSGSGSLRGVFTPGQAQLYNANNGQVTLEPFAVGAGTGAQWQCLYFSSEVGGSPRTITGFDFNKYALSFVTQITNCQIILGTTQATALTTNFASNYTGTPHTCAGPVGYTISTGTRQWHPGPGFSSNFSYNGSDNLILEIQHTGSNGGGWIPGTIGGANRGYAEWLELNRIATGGPVRAAHTAAANAQAVAGYGPSRAVALDYDTRFYYLIDQSEAQSLWYDSNITSPQYLDVVVVGDVPANTSLTFSFRGAPLLPLSTPPAPDTDNMGDWEPRLSDVGAFRFVQWHVDIKSDGASNAVPDIDELLMPFITYD